MKKLLFLLFFIPLFIACEKNKTIESEDEEKYYSLELSASRETTFYVQYKDLYQNVLYTDTVVSVKEYRRDSITAHSSYITGKAESGSFISQYWIIDDFTGFILENDSWNCNGTCAITVLFQGAY